MELRIASLADRPELGAIFEEFPDAWPEFLYHDPISVTLLDPLLRAYPESNLVAVDPADPGRAVARACAVPYRCAPDALPPGGYDDVILRGTAELGTGRGPVASALEITVRPDRQGQGVSRVILDALCRTLAGLGYTTLVAPVRPNRKHLHPTETMETYLRRIRPDGLPYDPWVRTHVRAGARIVGPAETSMTVTAPLESWRRWTGLPFEEFGEVIVPLALSTVHCDPANDVATYVEPNVWMLHPLT